MRKVVFLHIAKSGGTSFRAAMSASFPPEKICPELFSLRAWDPKDLARFDLFAGHFFYEEIGRIPGEKRIVTILREPKERLLSYYRFMRRHKRSHLERTHPEAIQIKGMTLKQYLLAGAPTFIPLVKQIGDGSLGATIGRLRQMDAIAILDDPASIERALWHDLALPNVVPMERLNVTAERNDAPFEDEPEPEIEPDEECRALLHEITKEERAVFSLVKEWLCEGPVQTDFWREASRIHPRRGLTT